jgi:hypothetical protein
VSTVDRPKYVLVEYGAVIAVVFALVGVAALAGAWTAAQPETTTEQVPVYEEGVSTTTDESAIVTGNTTLYDDGETLRNSPVYLFKASPNLTLAVNTTLDADRPATVTHRLRLRYRAVREDTTFWQNTTTYINESRTTNGTVSTTETLDVRSIRKRADQFASELGAAGDVTVDLLIDVSYDVREPPQYSGSMTTSAPLVLNSGSYYVDGDLSASQTEQQMETRTTESSPDPLSYLGLGVVGVLALAAAAGSVLVRRDIDAEAIRTRIYRNRYEEWISRGEIPTGTNKRYVRIDELEDIVDIGIDSNKRVIWNEEYDIYAVVDGDLVYYYTAGSAEIGDWLNV